MKSSIPSAPGLSRRNFLKTTACLTLGSTAAVHSLAAVLAETGGVALVIAPGDATAAAVPAQWARGELKAALEAQGVKTRLVSRIADAGVEEFCGARPKGHEDRLTVGGIGLG